MAVRRFFSAIVLLAALAAAFEDFARFDHGSQVSETDDGHIRRTHQVHHKFEEHGTEFKVNYHAEHHKKWHFVQLHQHVDEFNQKVVCGSADESELYVREPTEALVTELMHQNLEHTVITAHPRHHCAQKHIMRQVLRVVYYETDDVLYMHTAPLGYTDIFRHLKVSMKTDHLHAKVEDMKGYHPMDSKKFSGLSVPAVTESTTFATNVTRSTGRRMDEQWFHLGHDVSHLWHHVKDDVSSAAKRVVHAAAGVVHKAAKAIAPVAKKVGHAVGTVVSKVGKVCNDIATVGKIISGDYDSNKDWVLRGIHYNGDVSKTYNKDDLVTVHGSAASSFNFTPSINLDIDIHDYEALNIAAYAEGQLTAGISGQFGVSLQKTIEKKSQVADITLSPITFMIGPIPISIKFSIPINAGYKLEIDGQLAVHGVISAKGSAQYGYQYSKTDGHGPIRSHSFTYTHDFLPVDYSIEIGLMMFIQPVVNVEIDSILSTAVAIGIHGDVTLESNPTCIAQISVTAQPTVSIKAALDVTLWHHNIFQSSYGPHVLYSHMFPLYSYCKPFPSSLKPYVSAGSMERLGGSGFGSESDAFDGLSAMSAGGPVMPTFAQRRMNQQEDRRTVQRDFTLNNGPIVQSTTSALGSKYVGMAWSTQDRVCGANVALTEDVSAMFTTGPTPTSTILILTIAKTLQLYPVARGTHMSLVQAIYMMDQMLSSSTQATMTLLPDDGNYNHTSNNTNLPVYVAETITVAGLGSDMLAIGITTSMLCDGSVTINAPPLTNDNSTRWIYASNGARAVGGNPYGSAADGDISQTAVNSMLYYIIGAVVVALIAFAVAIFFATRRSHRDDARSALHTVNRKEAAEPMIDIQEGAVEEH